MTRPPRLAALAELVAPSIVALDLGGRVGAAFVAGEGGLIATNLHVVAGEEQIAAHLQDGRKLPVDAVAALDPRRDLAVLRLSLSGLPALPLASGALKEGEKVYVFGGPGVGEGLVENEVAGLQTLGDWLSIYILENLMPAEASGGPMLNEKGEVVGVLSLAATSEGPASIGIPVRYVSALSTAGPGLPLSALQRPAGRSGVHRSVPHHPLSMLDGCEGAELDGIRMAIAGAISVGAPTYNEGDFEGCYRIYADTARKLIAGDGCPGPREALAQGLARAEGLRDVDAQAWAMRDAFDGMLEVIERWFAARLTMVQRPGKKYLN